MGSLTQLLSARAALSNKKAFALSACVSAPDNSFPRFRQKPTLQTLEGSLLPSPTAVIAHLETCWLVFLQGSDNSVGIGKSVGKSDNFMKS